MYFSLNSLLNPYFVHVYKGNEHCLFEFKIYFFTIQTIEIAMLLLDSKTKHKKNHFTVTIV